MRPSKGFSREVKDLARSVYGGICWLCDKPGSEVHHRLANTVTNNKLYPRFLHSIFNASFLCRDCHDNRKHELDFGQGLVRVYENWLASWR